MAMSPATSDKLEVSTYRHKQSRQAQNPELMRVEKSVKFVNESREKRYT